MQAYRKSIGSEDTTLVISPNSDFFRFLAILQVSNSRNKFERLLADKPRENFARLFVALALVLVIEGLLYAAFPRQMRSIVERMTQFTDTHSGRQAYSQPRGGIIWIIKNSFDFLQPLQLITIKNNVLS